MNLVIIFGTAFGLAMDAFAVSLSSGLQSGKIKVSNALKLALFFGIFQAGMPILGWAAGIHIADYIEKYDHWVAFLMLLVIGLKMIKESFEPPTERPRNPFNTRLLFGLAIATSIDALAVGFSFAFVNIPLFPSVIIIGSVTFVLSILGVYLGKACGCLFGSRIEFLGGLILIIIGVKILIEHLTA